MADLEGRINLVGSNQPGSHMQAFSSSDAPPAPNLPLPPPGAPVRAYENTLNEPISETIMRDLRMIGYKLKYVLNPKMREERAQKLRDCSFSSISLQVTYFRGPLGTFDLVSFPRNVRS
eukprot:TRINITY_DN2426_c0_g1_i2.p1 TRINITY_DN2426_c0_g1~~TRINITY_DN2426_c0_g1_i2.p1  ORF type:complete len:119 (+),score=12.37 TRINITY_DN2426_c0_g1_i2:154-510(+)